MRAHGAKEVIYENVVNVGRMPAFHFRDNLE